MTRQGRPADLRSLIRCSCHLGFEAGEPPPDAGPRDLDRVARAIARGGPRLIVVDDVDRAGTQAVEFLALLASRLGSGATVLIATAESPLGLTPERRWWCWHASRCRRRFVAGSAWR
ncbi:hypothetical protein [Streptosporangium subroseum]|uniref:hypothetical protein n=1 Tax=Streptosporangium subroseum TaxID=106412 RepID=UPI00308CBA85|nr:hypothetical protein OHB15_21410 [Streptosporangium subroseum]